MKKIVLTGGPCAGKTTVLDAIWQKFQGKIAIVNEVATKLFSEGYPAPNPWTPEWQKNFQAAVIKSQNEVELRVWNLAMEQGLELIICDRGLLDGAAYMEGGKAEFLELFQVREEEALAAYDGVIHLESLATLNPTLFEELVSTNPHRYESLNLAQKRELALREAWAAHPNRIFLSGSLDDSATRVINFIEQNLN